MEKIEGTLICPQCHKEGIEILQKASRAVTVSNESRTFDIIDERQNESQYLNYLGIFQKYEGKRQYEQDKKLVMKYLFYHSSNYKFHGKCCVAFKWCGCDFNTADGCCKFVLGILYFSFFLFVIDIIAYFLCNVEHYYQAVFGILRERNVILVKTRVDTDKIWDIFDGISEKTFDLAYVARCNNCKFKPKSIINFIEIPVKSETTNQDPNRNVTINEEMITFNLQSADLYFTLSCPKNSKFSKAIDTLMEFHSDAFPNKNLIFLNNGDRIDINLTIEQNKIKNHDNILITENLMD